MFWKSVKVKRVVRSSLAAETLAFVEDSEIAYSIGRMIGEIFGNEDMYFPIKCITDNKSLHDASQTIKVVTDPRLKVEMAIVRQMVEKNEITVNWTETGKQLADSLTKEGSSSVDLLQVITTGDVRFG